MKKILIYINLFFLISINIFANEDKLTQEYEKKINYTIIPGPSFNPTTGLGISIIPVSVYDLFDSRTTRPSSSKLYFNGTETKSYMGAFLQEFYTENNSWKLNFLAGKGSLRNKYYGMGVNATDDYVWKRTDVQYAGTRIMKKVFNNLYIGGSFFALSTDPKGETEEAEEWLKRDGVTKTNNIGLGLNLLYDTRNNIFYPKSGVEIKINSNFYNEKLGSSNDYNTIDFSYSQYKSLDGTNKSIIAWNVYEYSALGDVPPGVGYKSPGKLRGYAHGKYMGKNLIIFQTEYRKKITNKIAFTVFGGVSKVFNSYDELGENEILPAGGAGLRYAVLPDRGMNARLDFVQSKDGSSIYFSIGEAF